MLWRRTTLEKTPLTVAHGDGIGPEIMGATLRILEAAGASLAIETVEIGKSVYERGFTAGTRHCPFDKDELVPYAMAQPSVSSMALPARGKICPTCGGRFDGNATFCGKDGTALVLLN